MAGENVGKAIVEIRADGTKLEKDIKEALDKQVGNHLIKLVAEIDLSKVKAELDKLKEEQPVHLKADIDLTNVRADLEKLRAEQEHNVVKIHAEVDSNAASESLRRITEDTHADPVQIHTQVDSNNLATDLRRAVEDAQNNPVTRPVLRPSVDSSYVQRSLMEIPEAKRFLDILPRIPSNVMNGLKGLGYSLLGAIPIGKYVEAISELAGNFESTALKAGMLSAKFGTMAAAIGGASGAALGMVGDLTQLTGLFALAPAGITAMQGAMFVLRESFKGFGQALAGNKQALAKFPADVQKIIVQLRSLNKDFTQPIKSAFWDEFGPTLIKVAKDDIPVLKTAFTGLAKELGTGFDNVLNKMHDFAASGGMGTALNNINVAFHNLGKAAGPFTEALNTLTLEGSKFFPGFANSIANAAQRFDDFIKKSAKLGDISMWISTATKTFDQLWTVAKNAVGIVTQLGDIAQKAGVGGVASLAKGLGNIRNTMETPAFKQGLTVFLQGAEAGAQNVVAGFRALEGSLARNAHALGEIVRLGGGLGGAVMTSISKAFDNTRLFSGLSTFLEDARKAAQNLAPNFHDAGNAIGDLFTMAGPMIQATSQGIGDMLTTVAKVIAALRDGFADAIPVFNKFMQGITEAFVGPVVAAAKVVGDLLETFAHLPKVVQDVIMTLGLLAFVLPKVANFFKGIKKGAEDVTSAFNTSWARSVTEAMARPFMGEGPIPPNALGNLAKAFKDFVTPIMGDIGASWSLMGEAAKNVASKIGQAFKGAFQDIAAGAKMLGESMASSISRNWQAVMDKLKSTGQTIGNLFQKFGSLFDAPIAYAKGKLTDLGSVIIKVAGTVGTVMKDMGKVFADLFTGGLGKLGDLMVKAGTGIAAPFVAAYKGITDFAQKAVSSFVSGSAALAQKAIGGIKSFATGVGTAVSNAFNTATGAVKDFAAKAFAPVGEFLGKVGSIAGSIGSVFGAVGSIIGQKIAGGVKGAISGIAGQFSELGRIIMTQSPIAQGIAKGFDAAKGAVKSFGDYVSTNSAKAWAGLKSGADFAVTAVGVKMLEMGDGIKNQMAKAAGAFSTFKDAIGQTMQSAAQRFAPIATAVQNFKESVGQMVSTTSEGFKTIGKAAAQSVGSGLKAAGASLVDALGGGWGIAIGLATTALTAWSQAQQEATQHAQDLAKTLDQTSGQITNATKKMIAQQSLDGVTNKWDDFWRGFVDRSGSVEESLGKMGTSLKDYNDIMSDDNARKDYIKSLDDARHAMLTFQPVTDDMAKGLHTTKEALSQMNTGDLDHMYNKANDLDEAMKKAEAQIKAVAESTGTTSQQASILQKNFDTLNSTTSTTSDKFNALRDNIELLNSAQDKASATTKNAQRDYAQSNLDLAKSFDSIKQANNGTVANLYDISKGFDFTKQSGIDFSKTMETSRDAILKLGADALQKAQQNGKTGVDAQKAALDAMTPAISSLETSLKNIGLSQGQIDGIIKEMGLVPDKLTTAIGITGGDAARSEIIRTQLLASAFGSGNYEAVLAALPNDAQVAIENATHMAGAFAKGDYKAILGALNQTKGGAAAALATILGVTNGDYNTPLKAMNVTMPGVDSARTTIGSLTDANWTALIKAAHDAGGDGLVEAAFEYLARPRTVRLVADASQVQSAEDYIKVKGGKYANGGFFGGTVHAFAGGGFENHVAQIAQPGVVPRIWAEAETGGEAYIPLGLDKRDRSVKILEKVAEIFGMSLMKKMSFADGGIVRNMPSASAIDAYRSSQSQGSQRPVPMSAPVGGGINLNVYPSQGLSEEQIGESAAKTLYWNMMTMPR